MWADFQEQINVQFSLKVALVKVSIFIFMYRRHTGLRYWQYWLKKKSNDCSKMAPLVWKYTLIIRLWKMCNLTQHVDSSILQHQKYDSAHVYCAFICHLLHQPAHASWNYNRKYIPANGESLTLVHMTILIKKYLRNKPWSTDLKSVYTCISMSNE